jgi:hypothetical protein
MTALRVSLLQGLDALAVSLQNAGQSFGFLSANYEAVVEREAGGSRFAMLSDKSREGWPAVELPLPADAAFQRAMGAVLTRTALWSTAEPAATVVALMTAHFGVRPGATGSRGPVVTLTLADRVTSIRIGAGANRTWIAIRQRRRPESISEILKARAAAR